MRIVRARDDDNSDKITKNKGRTKPFFEKGVFGGASFARGGGCGFEGPRTGRRAAGLWDGRLSIMYARDGTYPSEW